MVPFGYDFQIVGNVGAIWLVISTLPHWAEAR